MGGWKEIPIELRTLAIVGSHSATRELAPYDDLDVEIWLFNESAQKPEVYRRWDAMLQIHLPEVYTSLDNWVNKDHWPWLQQERGKPIYMQEVDPRVPDSVKYPLEEILKMTPRHYLRSSPAMALALAIFLGYRHIQLYGSELSSNTEGAYQGTNYAYWIGFADGRGIKLDLNCWQSEFNQRIYGYEGEFDIPREYFAERFTQNEAAWKNNENVLAKMKNQLDREMLEAKFDKVAQSMIEMENAAQAAGETAGAMAEDENYMKRENPISRQEFERREAKAQQAYNPKLQEMYHAGGKCEYVWNVWRQTGRNEALNQLRAFIQERLTAAYDAGAQKGIFMENNHYRGQYDELLTAAGGIRLPK